MKRIIYSAAIAALLVTSCQKTDVLNVAEDVIEFGTEVGKLTKAEDSTTPNYNINDPKYGTLVQQGFRVWAVADFTSGSYSDGKFYDGINGVDVNYTTAWGFEDGKHWWPSANQYLYFYMISSKNKTWLTDIKTANKFGDNTETTTDVESVILPVYTITPDTKIKVGNVEKNAVAVADNDIMVADHVRQDKNGQNGDKAVKPHFRHTMTKVQFNFVKGAQSAGGATPATNVILKSITTSPLKNNGILTVNYSKYDETTNTSTPATTPFTWNEPTGENVSSVPFTKESTNKVTYVIEGGAIIEPAASTDALPSNVAEGTLGVVYAADGTPTVYKYGKSTDSNENSWIVDTTPNTYKTVNGDVLTTDVNSFVTWYMIPQDLDDVVTDETTGDVTEEGTIVTIEYVADGKDITQKFSLAVAGVTEDWTQETCVRYNVTIAPHKIVFSPYVTDWDKNTNNKPEMNN